MPPPGCASSAGPVHTHSRPTKATSAQPTLTITLEAKNAMNSSPDESVCSLQQKASHALMPHQSIATAATAAPSTMPPRERGFTPTSTTLFSIIAGS